MSENEKLSYVGVSQCVWNVGVRLWTRYLYFVQDIHV